ncbi:MAG: amino acid racemase [Acidobacteriota bacterium]
MKTLGLIGGTGWISTVEYYRQINEETNRRLGGLEAARLVLVSLNYGDVDRLNRREDHAGVLALVLNAARVLKAGGAEGLVLCANTLHRYVEDLAGRVGVPIVHIAEAAAAEIRRRGLSRVGLLGTLPTMELDFYTGSLKRAGIEALVPEREERLFIHQAIYGELLKGVFRAETRARVLDVIGGLRRRGARGVVLGCTEIPLLIRQGDTDLPLFDTLAIHARAAVDFALEGS